MSTFAPDISEFQPVADDSFTRDWLTFRVCDGNYLDQNAAHNLAWATRARAVGRLANFGVYVVWRPGLNATVLDNLNRFSVPTDCVTMIDVEGWNGAISGDHSGEITELANLLRARQSGRDDLVWAYANSGDFAGIFPHRPAWLGLVVASYGSQRPVSPGPGPLAGWQYSDGSDGNPVAAGYPKSSAPFGRCDHNIIYSTPEADMPLTDADIAKIRDAVWSAPLTRTDPLTGKNLTIRAQDFLTLTWSYTRLNVVSLGNAKSGLLVRVATLQKSITDHFGSK